MPQPGCVNRSLNSVVNMVIQSVTLRSTVIREIRPYKGTHGGLSPAVHPEEPRPVRPRYQYNRTSGSHCAIVQLDNRYSPAKIALSLVLKIYTPYSQSYTMFFILVSTLVILFYFCARTRVSTHEPARPPAFFLSTV